MKRFLYSTKDFLISKKATFLYATRERLLENAVRHDRRRMEREYGIRRPVTDMGWIYEWTSGGILRRVVRPDGRPVEFRYDALGRRTAKRYLGKVTCWVWDGNTPLHEWVAAATDNDGREEVSCPDGNSLTT